LLHTIASSNPSSGKDLAINSSGGGIDHGARGKNGASPLDVAEGQVGSINKVEYNVTMVVVVDISHSKVTAVQVVSENSNEDGGSGGNIGNGKRTSTTEGRSINNKDIAFSISTSSQFNRFASIGGNNGMSRGNQAGNVVR
jgi:hypothetical protein